MKLKALSLSVGLLFLTLLPVACSDNAPPDPNAAYKSAINAYWRVHPRCLWTQPVKMPAQELAAKSGRTEGYDALTDMGMLRRSQAEKKTFIFGDKPVNVYDLTDQGRTAWVPVVRNPGYGNFCYGHRGVDTVDGVSLSSPIGSNPGMATVRYHFNIPDAADWAKNPELQTAFPAVATAFAQARTDTATLMKTSSGWVMTAFQVAPPAAVPPPDSSSPQSTLGSPQKDYGVAGEAPAPPARQ